MNLGNTIIEKRIEKQYTQEQLAKKLNVTKDMIIQWEYNDLCPNMDELTKLAKELDISLDVLFLSDGSTALKRVMHQTEKKPLTFAIIVCVATLCILLAVLLFSLMEQENKLFVAIIVIIGELLNLWAISYYIKKLND